MKNNQRSLSCIYEQIYTIKPINCIFKERQVDKYISVETITLPKLLKDKEIEVVEYFSSKQGIEQNYTGYAYKGVFQLRYLGVGVYEENEYVGHIILGPYWLDRYEGDEWATNILEENQVEMSHRRKMLEVYNKLPVLTVLQEMSIVKVVHALWKVRDINIKYIAPEQIKRAKHLVKEYKAETYDIESVLIRRHQEAERKIIYYICQGNEQKAIHSLYGLNGALTSQLGQSSIRSFKNLILTLNGMIKQALEKELIDVEILYYITGKLAINLEECTSFSQVQNYLKQLISIYCKVVNEVKNPGYTELTMRATQYIRFNFDKEITVKKLAQELFVSANHLSRKFKEETGYQISDYINKIRIEQAQLLLNDTKLSITDIAYTVGYNDEKYFSKVFKKVHQKTPREYRSS